MTKVQVKDGNVFRTVKEFKTSFATTDALSYAAAERVTGSVVVECDNGRVCCLDVRGGNRVGGWYFLDEESAQ